MAGTLGICAGGKKPRPPISLTLIALDYVPPKRSAAPCGVTPLVLETMRLAPEGQRPPPVFEEAFVGRGSLAGEYYEVGEAFGHILSY